jgi:hypothetical protein
MRDNPSLFKSALAERALQALQNEGYKSGLSRHTRLGVGALLVAFCGVLVSVWMLLRPVSSPQEAQFWLLCLILSGGVFGVAALTLAGSLLSHWAMQRLAVGQKDLEVYEVTRELELVFLGIETLASVAAYARAKHQLLDANLVEYSLQCIRSVDRAAPDRGYFTKELLDQWKAAGASSEKLSRIEGLT